MIRYIDENNKERLKTIGKLSQGIREAYCKAKLNEITTKVKLGEDFPHIARKKSSLTFYDLALKYFEDKAHTTKESIKEKARYENHIKSHIGFYLPENIDSDKILEMQKLYTNKFAPRTVNHLIFMIATIYRHAHKKGLYTGSFPTTAVDGLKLDNKRERYLETVEIHELIEEVKNISHKLWLFVKLSLSTGARISTVMNIKKKDIKLEW